MICKMQLKFKKILLLWIAFIYFASFLIQSNLTFFQVWAKEVNIPRVNIVTVLVDSKIYGWISWWLSSYASYIQGKLADTNVLIIPLDLDNIHAYDIYRMMENIYFDWLKDVNSSLIWLILVWDIPLPVVNQNGYIFPTIYPYVDFENQKYIWDPVSQYFVSNNNPMGQAEIWHWLINYWTATDLYLDYFDKVLNYAYDPDDFIWDRIWYDDFIAQKKWFVDENFQYYRNRIMFGEDLWYLRHSPLMSEIFKWDSSEWVNDTVDEINEFAKEAYGGDVYDWSDTLHNTKMVKQRIETSLTSDYSDLFSSEDMTTMRENVFVWWRWIREYTDASWEKLMMSDSDGSISKLQMKDDLLLWNDDVKWLIENLNELMEKMIDKKIEDEHIWMDIVVPISYEETTKKRVDFKCFSFVDRYENYYFGNNARLIDLPQDLSIYRWTYRNLLDLSWVTFDSLLEWKNPAKSEYEKTDLRLKSIWWTYDIFSSQAEGNRWYDVLWVERDLDIYDEEKTTADPKTHRDITRKVKRKVWPKICDDDDEDNVCETLYEFAKRWWWWASPINIVMEAFSSWRYELNDYLATDAWRRIFGMDWFQTLKVWEDEWMDWTGWKNWLWEWPQWAATSFEAYRKYSSPTQKQWWDNPKIFSPFYVVYENHTPTVHKPFSEIDYWQLPIPVVSTYTFYRDKNSDKVFYVEADSRGDILPCQWKRIQYGYRVISSVVKHDSTTEDQINGIDRDKYWETWTLWMYYRDIKKAFESVQSDMMEIESWLSGLIATIKSGDEYIHAKLQDLGAEVDNLLSIKESISELKIQLDDLQFQLSVAEESEEYEQYDNIVAQISELEAEMASKMEEKDGQQSIVDNILEQISKLIKDENSQLADIYKLMMSLYMGNIISEMEFIIYLEWGDPNDYHDWWAWTVKIWFLPSWMSNIWGMQDDIKSWINNIGKDYEDVYSMLEQQQSDWNKLASKLKDQESDNEKIDEVSQQMDQIFTISADSGEDWIESVTLTRWSANDTISALKNDYKKVDDMYSNLVEEDRAWLQIIQAAQSDPDFRLWMAKHRISSSDFSEEDWISQYAQWAKWPWYESPWAIKNHELLIGVSEHFSWMNILTADRPIDSPRYTVMQSVAGNEMKFIYPDLFKVEVYQLTWIDKDWNEIHELLTWGQIKKKLIKYLTWKVEEYNDIIEKECQNAKPIDIYYSRLLKDVKYIYATPIQSLHSCSRPFKYDEFLEAIWWEEVLDGISEALYYQSLTNKRKSSTWSVEKDIQLIRKSFSLNFKRKQLLEDYLIQWNEKIKNPILEIPMYELSGYEVAYINSDGMDHIFPPVDVESTQNEKFWSELLNLDEHPITMQESELADDCGIPPDWTLPVFSVSGWSPWLNWFKCWLRKTLEEPVNVKLKFDASLWEILLADSLKKDTKDSEDYRDLTKWWDASEYADHWDTLLQVWTWFDADKIITQLQVKAQQHNQEVMLWDDWEANLLSNIYREVKIDNSNVLLSDSNPNSELKIESAKDVWPITVTFKWTGDWCIKIDEKSLCTWQSFTTKPFNPKFNPFTGLVSTADNVAGKDGLIIQIQINVGWKYIENIIKYTVSPSTIQRFEIKIDDKKTVAWMISPVTVVWYDKNNNEVERWLEKYKFTVNQGRFLKDWAYQESFETNDFKNLKFYYQAPLDAVDWSEAIIQISRSNNPEEIIYSTGQKLIQANPIITLNWWTPILKWRDVLSVNQIYRLSSDETIYNWTDLDVSKLQKLDIDMRDDRWDLIDLDSQILVTSQNRLVTVWQVQSQENWKNIFFETSKVYMTWGHAVIYYYPTKVAWEEIINIDIPWLATRVINLTINPADSEEDPIIFQVKIPNNYVKLYDTTDFELFASDVWWNPVTRWFKVIFNPQKVDFPLLECYQCQDPESWVKMGDIKDWYLKTKVEWKGEWLEDIFVTNYGSIYVDVGRNLLPETWLNIMYLNYFWNDWWNQWWYFSDNDNYVEKLMSQSEKLITTTTQLVSEDKIKKVLWKIEPEFWIENYDGVDTVMTMQSNQMYMIIWWFSEMHAPMPSFTRMQVTTDSIETILNNKTSASKNYAFFIPNDPNYKIINGALYHSWIFLANLLDWELTFHLSDKILYWHNVWDVVDRGVNCGRLIIHYPNFKPSVQNFEEPWAGYIVSSVFSNWSSDDLSSVWVFDKLSDFVLDTRYKSIQNSDEIEEKVWFQWDFKNVTLFAEWEIVWEATRKYWSELLINLWDPVLSRKWPSMNVYGTNFDWWVWQEVLADYEDDILWVYRIDFNNDGLRDWLIVYLDWRLKLLKNYGWNPDLRDMQDLMRVAVHIQGAFVWDANDDDYEDIFVLTDNNQIRVYLNNWWIFDVDWYVACLNQDVFDNQKSDTPSNLEWVHQVFVEDMDWDTNADIITYDKKWYIKVFFWGKTNWWGNYLSKEKFACDTWRYDREKGNMTTVTALWVQISNADVFDNSMMTWKWIWFVNEGEPFRKFIPMPYLPKYWIYFDPTKLVDKIKNRERKMDWSIEKVTKEIMDKDKFNVTDATKRYIDEDAKVVEETLYENTLLGSDSKNYLFSPSSYLVPLKDTCSVWKNYKVKRWWTILQDWDIVTVKVTVQASILDPCIWAFWDIIQGPRNIYYDKNEIIMWNEGKTWVRPLDDRWGHAEVKKKDWNFAFFVDNITLNPWESMSFEYDLEYHQLPLKEMSITYDTFYGEWPDIKLQSVDGCDKNFMVFPGWWRSFSPIIIPLQDMIDEEYKEGDKLSNDYAADVISYGSDANKLPWIIWDTINRETLLRKKESSDDAVTATDDVKNQLLKNILGWLDSLKMDLLIDLSIFEDQSEAIEEIIDELVDWMCNWFKFWSSNCKWLPVPFNQAFLAPGKYHLFGCWELDVWPLVWWIPMFFFPGTLRTNFWDLPIPWWLKSPTEWFLWPWGWSYKSFIRIYAAPTLTAQLWIAVCMWNYDTAIKIKSPAADLWWNCVVFAVQPKCSNGKKNSEKKEDKANPNPVYNKITEEVKNSWLCWQSQKWTMVIEAWERSSPFNLCSFSSTFHKEEPKKDPFISARNRFNENVDVGWWSYNQVDYRTSFLWIVELETTSYIWQDDDTSESNNSIFVWDVDVLWWDYTVNKIKWWIQNWLRKLLIDKWLDPQIRYIANQLTKMHVNIKLPDLSNMIDREVETLKWIWDKTSTIFASDDDEYKSAPMTRWSDISNETLENFGKSISNPFESLASLFNESNIINISTELITVKVPMVFKEDIDAYSLYLQQWLEENERIINDWENVLRPLVSNCSAIEDEKERSVCYDTAKRNLDAFIEFKWRDWDKMQNQIYANLMILQEYRDFPFEIYERIHVVDRYVAEIAQLISDTIWYLWFWTSTNAERFVWYVDAIVLILNIIKTYQILIDFSIEWWEKCGSCTKDTYDQYTCKLSILCDGLQLPIIQIPNFKLPNITIDLTDIDLWLDIILPEFNFQPVKIDLPDLFNLPEPPSIWANIKLFDLPDIPLLPEPPELPELPSFIPEVELELPMLPPAPEVPKIPWAIEAIIKAADLIWKIMCIVKWRFWLVWESSVKAKIEQLTQRTYDVKWIDSIMDFTNWSVAPIHNYGLDYEISSRVDLQFNFTDFYNYLDALTKSINSLSTSSVNWLNKETNSLVEENPILSTFESIDSQNVQFNADLSFAGSWKNIDIPWLLADEVEYVDYDSGKSRLQEVLAYFREETRDTTLGDSLNAKIKKIENQINRKNKVESNVKWLEELKNEVFDYLDKEKMKYDSLSDMINNDYEWFLAMVDSNSKNSKNPGSWTWWLLTFNLQLFNADSSTKEAIDNIKTSNPYQDLIDNKKSIIDGYRNAINSSTANDLGLSQSQYLVLRDGIWEVQSQVATLYRVTRSASTKLIAKDSKQISNKSLLSFDSRGARLWSNLEVSHAIDPSVLSNWIYDKIQFWADEWKLTKVVYSDSFAEAIGEKYYRDNGNIVLWDKNTVYQKCLGQVCADWWWWGWVYSSKVVKQIPYEETWLPFDKKNIELKIADVDEEIKNRKVYGQSYDTLSMSWTLGDADAYLIKLVERIDHSYEKADYDVKTPVHYVLALPEWTDLDELYQKKTKLELLSKKGLIENLYAGEDSDEPKEITQIAFYNPHKSAGDVSLSNVERKWYYARIAALNYDAEDKIYNIDSPWSNQIVAWKQMAWDEQPPVWTAELHRPSVWKVVSQWDELEWYVWTEYILKVTWRDNVALYYINLSKDGKTIENYTDKDEDYVSIKVPIHTGEVSETYNSVWIDQFGNKTEKVITINFLIPEITITDVSKQEWEDVVRVNARLSQDIDQWNVSFQRRRWSAWKTMIDKSGNSDISLGPKVINVAWNYTAWNEIAMYDKNGEVMALMDPDTAEIKLQPGYEDTYNVKVKIADSPVLQVCNKEAQPKFSIVLPTQECVKIEADNYDKSKLDEIWMMWRFNWWYLISKNWTNILYISPSCYLYSELWLEWEYSYDRELDAVLLTLYQSSDYLKKNPIKVWMKVKPFLEN